MSDAEPRYNYFKDEKPDTVLPDLKKWIDWHIRRKDVAYFYIGQSCNPERRLTQHQRKWRNGGADAYDSMDVIFGSRNYGDALKVERELIASVKDDPKFEDHGLNVGSGLHEGLSDYVLYVLTDHSSPAKKRGKDANLKPTEIMKPTRDGGGEKLGLDALEGKLCQKLESAIADRPDHQQKLRFFYIGMTDHAPRRFKQHQEKMEFEYGDDIWDEMKILFRSPDLNRVTNMESRLIDYAFDKHPKTCFNRSRGRQLEDDKRLPYTYVYYLEERDPGKYGL